MPPVKPSPKRKGATGTKPGMERIIELRSRPDAVTSGKLTSPWAAIRYVLMKAQDPAASELAEEIADVLAELQIARRDPTKARSFEELSADLAALEAKVAASPWASDPDVAASLERHQSLLVEYAEADDDPDAADGEGTAAEQQDH